MSKKVKLDKLDKFHYHEALDRAYLVLRIFNEYLLNHPVIEKHKELKKSAKEIANILYLFYCLIPQYKPKGK